MDTAGTNNLSMDGALNESQHQRAVYEHDGKRVFVSRRNDKFDLGLPESGQAVRVNIAKPVLDTLLAEHHVPKERGWRTA